MGYERQFVSNPLSIEGAISIGLNKHMDARGWFVELFRVSWDFGMQPQQWNAVRTSANCIRGAHVHPKYDDYFVLLDGCCKIALIDLRVGSSTYKSQEAVSLDSHQMVGVFIPRGVLHGFYFRESSVHVYTNSDFWRPEDEMGCRWDDPALAFVWGDVLDPLISEKDQKLGSLDELIAQLELYQPIEP